jgi:hypothetical protein
MMKCVCACFFGVLLFACNKKEPATGERVAIAPTTMAVEPDCVKEIVTKTEVKVGETGILLPVGSKLCFSKDNLEIKVELPAGYNFLSNKTLPIYATYACNCSASGSACQVFYADGLGFGCLQSSCSGSCTGKFTYHGYSVDRVIAGKSDFFNLPEVQKEIAAMHTDEAYSKESIYGVTFFIVNDEKKFMASGATCNCEGTQACKLKTLNILGKKIYFCEGACNGCELTV